MAPVQMANAGFVRNEFTNGLLTLNPSI